MRVKVARNSDINPADIIIEKLLTTEQAMVERGRNELDQNQFSRMPRTMSAPLDKDILPGQMIQVVEADTGVVWRGKVLSVNINISNPKITQTLKVDRIIL